jgi:hypothetical protein
MSARSDGHDIPFDWLKKPPGGYPLAPMRVVPTRLAGFVAIEPVAHGDERIAWNDPDLDIAWPLPVAELNVSERDSTAPLLREVAEELPFSYDGA